MKMKGKRLGKAVRLNLTADQHKRLQDFTTGQGGYQSLCARVYDSVKVVNGIPVAVVYENDMERIRAVADRADSGGWQDLFREILAANP